MPLLHWSIWTFLQTYQEYYRHYFFTQKFPFSRAPVHYPFRRRPNLQFKSDIDNILAGFEKGLRLHSSEFDGKGWRESAEGGNCRDKWGYMLGFFALHFVNWPSRIPFAWSKFSQSAYFWFKQFTDSRGRVWLNLS